MLIKASAPGLFPLTGGFFMGSRYAWLFMFDDLNNTDFVRARKGFTVNIYV